MTQLTHIGMAGDTSTQAGALRSRSGSRELGRRRWLSLLLALFALGAVVLAAPRMAHAQAVSAEVRVILGSAGDGGVDASLEPLASRLTRQFAQFNTFRQASSHRLNLSVGQAQTISLPGGQSATIEFLGTAGAEQELRISIPGGGTTIRTRGGQFFVGGAAVPGGTLILAIST